MAALTATELRRNIYRVLDEVLKSGVPQEVERKGQVLLIAPAARDPQLHLRRARGHPLGVGA